MTGKELKDILYNHGVSQSEIAKKLGLSQQSFSQMLSSSDIKTSLLERIAGALGVTMSLFYPMDGSTVASGTGSVAVSGNNNVAGNNVSGNGSEELVLVINELAAQRRVTEKAQEQIDRLISLLEKR